MTIEVSIFGFGDDRPARFGKASRLVLTLDLPASPLAVLGECGFEGVEGFAIIVNDQVVPPPAWQENSLRDGDRLTILSTFEGG